MKRIFLLGKRVYLRALEKEDVEGNYIHWFDDEEVCKYNGHHIFPYSKEQLERYITNVLSSKDNIVLAIIDKETDNHIGNISLQKIDYINKNAELAIIVGEKDYWGKGIAKEATKLIVKHGFNTMNLYRIYCGTSSENIPMQKLALSLGFQQEGLRRKAIFKSGSYYDIVEYGILCNEWNSKNIESSR